MEYIIEWNKTTFYVVNLYPSVPFDEAVTLTFEIFDKDIDDLRKPTKLTVTGIHRLIKLCLKYKFLYFPQSV